MTYYTEADRAAEEFFRKAAEREGLPYPEWCRKNGIIDAAALHRINRNEQSRDAGPRNDSLFVSAEEWTRAYKWRARGVTNREDCAHRQHDAGGIVGPIPESVERRPSVADAAE